MINLPNLGKSAPELTDPAQIQVVSDALVAVDVAIGDQVSDLATTAKTIVPAINELHANSSLLGGATQLYSGSLAIGDSITVSVAPTKFHLLVILVGDVAGNSYSLGQVFMSPSVSTVAYVAAPYTTLATYIRVSMSGTTFAFNDCGTPDLRIKAIYGLLRTSV